MMILRWIAAGALEAVIGGIHDLMPVILDERMAEDWMNPREKNVLSLKRLLVPAPSESARDAAGVAAREQREKRGSHALQGAEGMFKTANAPSNACAMLAASSCG